MEARKDAKVYEEDVVSRTAAKRNGTHSPMDRAQMVLDHAEEHSSEEVAKAKQYLYGS